MCVYLHIYIYIYIYFKNESHDAHLLRADTGTRTMSSVAPAHQKMICTSELSVSVRKEPSAVPTWTWPGRPVVKVLGTGSGTSGM